jgi:signal transduction histidine kinase
MSAAAQFTWLAEDPSPELRSAFQNAPLPLAELQPSGTLRDLNPAMERLLQDGTRSGEQPRLPDLIARQERDECEGLLAEVFDGRRSSFQIESQATWNAASTRWTVWRVDRGDHSNQSILALAEGLPLSLGTSEPLSGERLKTVGRLASAAAHDFNNLLTGILLYCDLLTSSLEPDHRARKYAEEIRNTGLQATGLVRQLLSIAKPMSAEPRLLSLNEVVEGMRDLLCRLIGELIGMKFCLDPELGLVRMDPTRAQQILLNLVLNARDAMPIGGQITVATENCELQILAQASAGGESLHCVLFRVTDTGSGMDATTRAHLFEPFFTTKPEKGTGLGLATVHEIVSASGGLVHVDSELGRGTRISVLLPVAPEPLPGPRPPQTLAHDNGQIACFKQEE